MLLKRLESRAVFQAVRECGGSERVRGNDRNGPKLDPVRKPYESAEAPKGCAETAETDPNWTPSGGRTKVRRPL